jgi:hypothetical protein
MDVRRAPLRTLPADTRAPADYGPHHWFGFLCADGCIVQRRGCGEVHLVLAQRDIGHLQRFAAFVGTDKPVRKETHHDTDRLGLYSRHMSDDLIRLGCPPRKSLTLTYPAISPALEAHFVRGYFDGDGSAHKGGCATGGILSLVGTSAFLEGVREAIRTATGAAGTLKPHSHSTIMYLRYSGAFQMWAVADWLYSGTTVYLERKQAAVVALPRGKRKGYPTVGRYVGTAGNVSSETIRTSIEAQKGM